MQIFACLCSLCKVLKSGVPQAFWSFVFWFFWVTEVEIFYFKNLIWIHDCHYKILRVKMGHSSKKKDFC